MICSGYVSIQNYFIFLYLFYLFIYRLINDAVSATKFRHVHEEQLEPSVAHWPNFALNVECRVTE